jgi:hypothetical protein
MPSSVADEKLAPKSRQSAISELTGAVFGRALSLQEALALVDQDLGEPRSTGERSNDAVWIGSIGYEAFTTNEDFADALAAAGRLQIRSANPGTAVSAVFDTSVPY